MMKYDDVRGHHAGHVNEVDIGGGRTIGGETALGPAGFEGSFPNRPLVAMEINDTVPRGWPGMLRESIGNDVLSDPAVWAKKCVDGFGADAVFFDMTGTHQDRENVSPDDAAGNLVTVLDAVNVPVFVRPWGSFDKKNAIIVRCAERATRRVVLGSAVQENYRTIVAAALASDHLLVAESPIDVNIAKQLDILITRMNCPIERVLVDPLTGGLGYGFEYTYSVMERIRLQTFAGDEMMSPPFVCLVGQETWRIKEVRLGDAAMGDPLERAIDWETATAVGLLLAGANVVSLRHPESVRRIGAFIGNTYPARA
jgi:acetyl-CoA decarbonylase/synthase complex subunit delta